MRKQLLLIYYNSISFFARFEMESCTELKEVMHVAKYTVKNKPMYANILWKDDDSDLFHIKLFYEDNSWTGKFSKDLAAKRRDRLDETAEEYSKNVQDSLIGNFRDYVYDFNKNSDGTTATFVWKKQFEGAVQVHGCVSLQLDEVPLSKDTLLDILLEKNNKLILDVEHATKVNNDLKQNLEQYSQKLEELIETKTTLESTLYERFVQVLNEKKKRIQLLEEHIKNL